MTLHVVFTPEGIPGWIGDQPREGSEPVEGLDLAFLAGHRRAAGGKWVARKAVAPMEPSPEDLAARTEAEYRAALEERTAMVRQALAEEADPLFFKWQRDEATREDWLSKVAEVKARYPKP
ncbi:MAG: hypothetical protein B7Z10_04765 [Rhodobacterales bacterium 32-66-7]|nr:MAG: hypothetical protein B7Z31_06235 [Rhodobacterales bacterium 12-65-15]OYX25934.1 MAG: hypothetical protein B7Z10_04765 [Rhodobacterales bacterium 32-66-7]